MNDELTRLKKQQQQILDAYEELLQKYDSDDLIHQNELLQTQLDKVAKALDAMQREHESLSVENQQLKISLKEQMLDEKLNILKISQDKLNTYFNSANQSCENRLILLEQQTKATIANLKNDALKELGAEQENFTAELARLDQTLQNAVQKHRNRLTAASNDARSKQKFEFNQLSESDLSEEAIQKRIKQNETEMKIGLNWINKIGILLILFGIGAAAKYVHSTLFNDYMRAASFFLLGSLFLVGGEYMYRKSKTTFANGLLGGGVAILYCAVFYSYFLLSILDLYTGLFLSVLITVITVVFSLRYRSETICSLGLIGGYLPFFTFIASFGLDGNTCYTAMSYLLLLNLSVLAVSYRQKWNSVNYLSMLFHLPSMIYVVFHIDNVFIGMLYTLITFTTLLLGKLAYPLKFGVALKKMDLIFIAANTTLSCITLYGLLQKGDLSSFNGLLALLFCLIYTYLGNFVSKKIPDEKATKVIFYTTSLTFAILMVPFQLGIRWLSIGWLLEGMILIIYGLKHQLPKLEKIGWAIFGLCLGTFYLVDWVSDNTAYFCLKFTAVTIGTMFITYTYQKNTSFFYGKLGDVIMNFKYFTLFNAWAYLQYIALQAYAAYMPFGNHFTFYKLILIAAINIGFAYGLRRIPIFSPQPVQIISAGLYALGILICLIVNLFIPIIEKHTVLAAAEYGAIAVLLLFNLLLLAVFKELLAAVISQRRLNFEFYPLGIIIYFMGTATTILIRQFHFGSGHFIASLALLFTALASLIYGFRKNYAYTRRFGLGLSILATTKLFIFDLAFLNTFNKIIAYFIFGFVLLGISYLYQRLKSAAEEHAHEAEI